MPGPATTRRRWRTPRPVWPCGRGRGRRYRPGRPAAALRAERASTYRSLGRARALALSRLGRHAEAADELARLARERPRDEEVLAELLRGEAATVGPSAALDRYEAYRRSLRDELGTDPGPALQAVHQQLLQGTAPVVRHGVAYEAQPAARPRRRHRRCGGPAALGPDHLDRRSRRPRQDPSRAGGEPPGGAADRPLRPARRRRPRRRRRRDEVAAALGAGGLDAPSASAPSPPASSPASRPCSVPARHCWCWTTASMSCAAPPSWRAPWCR